MYVTTIATSLHAQMMDKLNYGSVVNWREKMSPTGPNRHLTSKVKHSVKMLCKFCEIDLACKSKLLLCH